MLGAVIGDIVGSEYEFGDIKTKEFELFGAECCFTDDSAMTIAIADALIEYHAQGGDLSGIAVEKMRCHGLRYPNAGYGLKFLEWISSLDPRPYNSWGNGSAMRVSPVGLVANTLDEALEMSDLVTKVTHNHPEGMAGGAIVAACVFLARTGVSKDEIREYVRKYYDPLDFTLDSIRDGYGFDVSCRGSVPHAIMAFLESTSFEDAVRNAVSIGGDSDTIAAIAGGIAGPYYGIPNAIRQKALSYLDDFQLEIVHEFEKIWPEKVL